MWGASVGCLQSSSQRSWQSDQNPHKSPQGGEIRTWQLSHGKGNPGFAEHSRACWRWRNQSRSQASGNPREGCAGGSKASHSAARDSGCPQRGDTGTRHRGTATAPRETRGWRRQWASAASILQCSRAGGDWAETPNPKPSNGEKFRQKPELLSQSLCCSTPTSVTTEQDVPLTPCVSGRESGTG